MVRQVSALRLKKEIEAVDVMALIIFSLSSASYAKGSWEKEETEHLEAVFREMVEEGEQVTPEDLETASDVLLRVLASQWK